MMPAAQTNRFANAFTKTWTQIHYIPNAGHFAALDQPTFVSETILNFTRQLFMMGLIDLNLSQAFMGYYITRWQGDEEYLLKFLNKNN